MNGRDVAFLIVNVRNCRDAFTNSIDPDELIRVCATCHDNHVDTIESDMNIDIFHFNRADNDIITLL